MVERTQKSGMLQIKAQFDLAGDQAQAVDSLSEGLRNNIHFQTLKGVTGSGKTFTMAKIIERVQRPALVLSHNKTLAAQLYREFKELFPRNAVEYFVSYYDYYQPEAYVPGKDLFIEKDSSINDEIDRLRLAATASLQSRTDVIIVATVSCIFGLGNPEDYAQMSVSVSKGEEIDVLSFRSRLISLQYKRNDDVLQRGSFRISGDTIDIYPAYEEQVYRVSCEWDRIESIQRLHPVSMELMGEQDRLLVFSAKHFVTPEEKLKRAIGDIKKEFEKRYEKLSHTGRVLEAERLKSRTEYDIEMLETINTCPGIENYSMHISGRKPGERPAVLLDYFPKNFMLFVDESHVSIPQVGAMFNGDRARKDNLVRYGFRLPSARDNRPLRFEEFEAMIPQCIFVSATPGPYELRHSENIVEQLIRPTGLLDPIVEVKSTKGQIEDLVGHIRKNVERNERVLVTTLTKKMAESLTDYLRDLGIRVSYLHADIGTVERVETLVQLRKGEIDGIVGINLLREGLDLPEVSLVAILDADKIGFLRSATSLVQTIGRAARNINGHVIMYADTVTSAMDYALSETNRRRKIQQAHNEKHHISPQTIRKAVRDIIVRTAEVKKDAVSKSLEALRASTNMLTVTGRKKLIAELRRRMREHAEKLEFEEAMVLRDEIETLRKRKKTAS